MPRKPAPRVEKYEGKRGTTYRVRVRNDGRQTTETFHNFAAARAFAETVAEEGVTAALADRESTDRNSAAYVPTLAELLTKHVNDLTGIDQRTREDYAKMAARSFLPILGRTRVNNFDRSHVARFVNARDGQVAPKTIKNEHSLLSAVLETAVREGHLATNPARGTKLPRAGEEHVDDIRFLTYAEFDQLVSAVRQIHPHYLPMVILLFGTGLRFSEATALQVQDINPDAGHDRGTLRVMRAWKREKGGLRLGPPKSKASRRTIWIDRTVLDALMPLLDGRKGTEWLFTTATGRHVQHSNFYNRIWAPSCAAAGLDPRPRIHDARHTHASWLIAEGARLEVVQDRLGHEDYMTTRKVYAHLMPDMRREAGMAAEMAFASTSLAQPARLAVTDGPGSHPPVPVARPGT